MVALAIEPSQWSAMLSSSGSSSPVREKKVTGKLSPLEPVVHTWDVRDSFGRSRRRENSESIERESWQEEQPGSGILILQIPENHRTIINHRCQVISRRVRTSTGNECRIGQM